LYSIFQCQIFSFEPYTKYCFKKQYQDTVLPEKNKTNSVNYPDESAKLNFRPATASFYYKQM